MGRRTRAHRGGSHLCVAPLDVAGPMRAGLLAEKTAVFTSATLKLGGDFDAVATSLGLDVKDRGEGWEGLDVGSPFDYQRQAILYVARHLPRPGRDGLTSAHSTRSSRSSRRRAVARSGCSPAVGPPSERPSTCARRCPS